VTILAAGIIISVTPRRAVGGSQCVNAAFEMLAYLGMCKDDLSRWFFYMATTQAIHWFSIVVRNLLDIGVTTFAANARVGALAEELFVHIEETIVSIFVHAGKTSEAVAHETVL
jgi:hypothetical protein